MKKILPIILLLALVFSFSACGSKDDDAQLSFAYTIPTEETTETTEESTTETTTKETTTETTTEATTETATETTTETTTKETTTEEDENAFVGKVQNGKVSQKDGIYYITDESTGVRFIIANKTYKLPKDYNPGGLSSECSSAFKKLTAAAADEGLEIWNRSGFRSYSYQTQLYNNYVSRDGREAADKYSARPGYSEHQTGLAIDCNELSTSWGETPAGKWLAAHCFEYGFIIRYGADKIDSTGYQYEPWHIRYLGSPELAKKITESGLSIEEYYGITSVYS